MPATNAFTHNLASMISSCYHHKSSTSPISIDIGGPVVSSLSVTLDLSTFDPDTSSTLKGSVVLELKKPLVGVGVLTMEVAWLRYDAKLLEPIETRMEKGVVPVWRVEKPGDIQVVHGKSEQTLPVGIHIFPFEFPWKMTLGFNPSVPTTLPSLEYILRFELTREPLDFLKPVRIFTSVLVERLQEGVPPYVKQQAPKHKRRGHAFVTTAVGLL